MKRLDPRLADATLLALAAQRLLARQDRPPPPPDWHEGAGLANLLQYARSFPRTDGDAVGLDQTTGLGKLLAEARRHQGETP